MPLQAIDKRLTCWISMNYGIYILTVRPTDQENRKERNQLAWDEFIFQTVWSWRTPDLPTVAGSGQYSSLPPQHDQQQEKKKKLQWEEEIDLLSCSVVHWQHNGLLAAQRFLFCCFMVAEVSSREWGCSATSVLKTITFYPWMVGYYVRRSGL